MRWALGVANLLLGIVYSSYGIMTLIDLKRGWKTFGFSHFALAWILMAFTCGPHHLAHAVHLLLDGRAGGGLDLLAVMAGAPAGVTWFALRVEAVRGGLGDRGFTGSPLWIASLPTAAGIYLTVFAFGVVNASGPGLGVAPLIFPNLALIAIYFGVGYYVLASQLKNHKATGGWSLSGLCLAVIFPTCALMHAAYAVHSATGLYHFDPHGFYIDWLSVPAGLYFLWVVRSLHRERLTDWNSAVSDVSRELVPA